MDLSLSPNISDVSLINANTNNSYINYGLAISENK